MTKKNEKIDQIQGFIQTSIETVDNWAAKITDDFDKIVIDVSTHIIDVGQKVMADLDKQKDPEPPKPDEKSFEYMKEKVESVYGSDNVPDKNIPNIYKILNIIYNWD